MEEFDAVYPFAGDDFFELEHSIRRLRKYAVGLRDIYIIGDETPLKDVIHIPFIQEDLKENNIWQKTLAASFIPQISKDFLFINDDHFLMDEIDLFLGDFYYKDIKDIESEGQYAEAVQNTIELLEKNNLNTKNFDIHCPIFINKVFFQAMFSLFYDGKERLMKSCYCNFHKIEGEEMEDLKFRNLVSMPDILKFTAGRWVFSTWEHTLTHDLKEFITK